MKNERRMDSPSNLIAVNMIGIAVFVKTSSRLGQEQLNDKFDTGNNDGITPPYLTVDLYGKTPHIWYYNYSVPVTESELNNEVNRTQCHVVIPYARCTCVLTLVPIFSLVLACWRLHPSPPTLRLICLSHPRSVSPAAAPVPEPPYQHLFSLVLV